METNGQKLYKEREILYKLIENALNEGKSIYQKNIILQSKKVDRLIIKELELKLFSYGNSVFT